MYEYANLFVCPLFFTFIQRSEYMSEEMIVIDNRSDEIKLVNQRQVFLYVKNGLQPIRLENGYEDKLVYVFSRSESEELFELWRKHELV